MNERCRNSINWSILLFDAKWNWDYYSKEKATLLHLAFYARWLANSLAYQLHNLLKNFQDFFSTLILDILCWSFAKDSLISVIILSWGHCVENRKQLGLFCKLFCWICLMSILFILSFRSWRGFTKWPWGAFWLSKPSFVF